MKQRTFLRSTLAIAAQLLLIFPAAGKDKGFAPNLTKLAESKGGRVYNRAVTVIEAGSVKGIRLDERKGAGIAWIEGYEFGNGIIEFEVRGNPQKSFLGVAFHGVDDETYDAVYFRPFNFKTEDPDRRAHAVQYVSHPTFTWQKLRSEHANTYEKPIQSPPDPDTWFHVRIVVNSPTVSVFVNDSKAPDLVVEQLSTRKKGKIGIWVGDDSGGDFAKLRVTPAG